MKLTNNVHVYLSDFWSLNLGKVGDLLFTINIKTFQHFVICNTSERQHNKSYLMLLLKCFTFFCYLDVGLHDVKCSHLTGCIDRINKTG